MIAKLAETTSSASTTNSNGISSIVGGKFLLSKEAHQNVAKCSSSSGGGKKIESSSQSKRKRAKLLDQLLQTNWSKQSQQASNLMKLNKMLLVCDANFLDEKSGQSPLGLAISSAQINNASHQMLFTSISAHSSSQTSSSSASSNGTNSNSLLNLQCQIPVHGLGRLELISLQQASITELIQSKAPLIQRILLLLIKSGALIDFRNSDGRTPLHVAAMKSNFWALKTLLDLGASTDYRDINGLTPLYYSILQKADLKVTQLLLNHNRSPTANHYSNSCNDGSGSMTAQSSDRVRAEPACTSTTDDHGWQEVHHACKLGLDAHLEALIYYGCDIDAKISGSGNTPLHVAAINDQLNCAKVLLMRGADKTITNNSHQTAHQVAVVSGNMDLAEFIAQHNDSMMVPFRNTNAPSAQKPNITSNNSNDNVGRSSDERPFAMFSSRSSANIRVDSQQTASSLALFQAQQQQRHMNPLSLDVFAPTTNPTTIAAASSGSSNTTNSSNQSLLSIGGSRNQSQFGAHFSNISPCLSQRSCATSNTTTSSGVCCEGDGNQSNEEQQHHSKEHLSSSHSQHSNVTIISIKNGAIDSTKVSHGKESLRTGGGDDYDDLRSSSDDGNSNGSSSSCADDLYSLMSEQRPLYAGTIVEAVSEYQSGDPNHLQLHRGDLIEVLDYTPELLNAGQLPRLANKPMIFGRRVSDSSTGLFPSFCVRRTKHKSSNQKPHNMRSITNIDPSIMDESNTQWPTVHNDISRPLSESQSMASLDRKSTSSLSFVRSEDSTKLPCRELNVTLAKNNHGFGFVLRGAKIDPNLTQANESSLAGTNRSNSSGVALIDERMMAANNLISLQYLDDIEPNSAADKAGLKRGDFLLAVNGEEVRMSSHEQVVHMIRQSGNQVQLTIATQISQSTVASGQTTNQQPIYSSRTLTRNKPEPPRRDPTTTLTRNKTQRVKSMIVQPQRQVQNLFDADKPLPCAPNPNEPLSPSGSLNMNRSVSTQLSHFNSIQSLSNSSVMIDNQSICSVSTLGADQQQSTESPVHLSGGDKRTPTQSSSSTTTLTTIAGIKPKAPPKPNLSQISTSVSQQAIYQPAVITTSKRPTPPTTSPQTPPKAQSVAVESAPPMPPPPPPPPPPLPDFSIATPQMNSSRLVGRRTSAPMNQSLKDSINETKLLKKRESVSTMGHYPTPEATEMGAVAAACAAAANSRLQRQQQIQKQPEESPPSEEAAVMVTRGTEPFESANGGTPALETTLKRENIAEHNASKELQSIDGPERILSSITQKHVASEDPVSNRTAATASLGRKSSAQIIQQPKQMVSHSQTLRARPKQRPAIPDYNELPPPPPPLPSTSEIEFTSLLQQTSYVGAPMQQTHRNHHHSDRNHTPAEQIDLDRQQAYSRRSRDEVNMSLNNKDEFFRRQQQQHYQHELAKHQLRQQQLLQQQQLKIQQHMQLQHQKCCINANISHEHHHGVMRCGSNSTPQVHDNHEPIQQQAFDRTLVKQLKHPPTQQAMVVSSRASAHQHHHHHNHNSQHRHHHNNCADSLTMPANSQHHHQQQQQPHHHHHHHHHHHQKHNDHLQQDIYQLQPLDVQAPVMYDHTHHNHVQERAVDLQQQHHQQQLLQQQYYQRLQQQQILTDRYMPVAHMPDNFSVLNTRNS